MSHNGSSETSSFADECWASWFCSAVGHEYFCEVNIYTINVNNNTTNTNTNNNNQQVSKDYIEDSFNLFGLKQYLPLHYSKALDTILDRTSNSINNINNINNTNSTNNINNTNHTNTN